MIVSAAQPYFAPFPGFFAKAARSDVLVLLDSVQFPRGTTWLTRNRFKNDQGVLWLTVPVWKKGLGLQRINEVRICHEGRWVRKHLQSLKTAYRNAPFFSDHVTFLEEVYGSGCNRLVDFNLEIIQYLISRLGISSRILLLSQLGLHQKEPELSVALCRELGGSRFLAQGGARNHLDVAAFQAAGISLEFFTPRPQVYPQLWGEFVSNLSAFDLLFNCGPRAGRFLEK